MYNIWQRSSAMTIKCSESFQSKLFFSTKYLQSYMHVHHVRAYIVRDSQTTQTSPNKEVLDYHVLPLALTSAT